jgi:peptidoglycan/LPS O-acetylase OafA/YrhL
MNNNRRFELDFLRCFAIIFVIITHSPEYIHNSAFLGCFSPYFGLMGVGVFVFISGYSLHLNNKISSFKDIGTFYKKRFFKIYPLYILILFIFIVLYGYIAPNFVDKTFNEYFTGINIFIHIMGAQLIFVAYSNPIWTIWYIGLILIYYAIYPMLLYNSNSIATIFIKSIVVILMLILANHFNLFDTRVFIYYWIFIVGIVLERSKILEKYIAFNICSILLIILPFSLILHLRVSQINSEPTMKLVLTIISYSLIIISFCMMELLLIGHTPILKYKKLNFLITSIAKSSYIIYLFHRPFLDISTGFLSILGIPTWLRDILTITISLPSLFILCYLITSPQLKAKLKSIWCLR